MKIIRNAVLCLTGLMLLTSWVSSERMINPANMFSNVEDFLGQWTIDIEGGYVGWLEVRQENGYLDADLLWKWASVSPVANVYLHNGHLIVTRTENIVRTTDNNGQVTRQHTQTFVFDAILDGKILKGYFFEPSKDGLSVDSTAFTGYLLPPVHSAPNLDQLRYGEQIVLFDGKDMEGWELTNPQQVNGFKLENGIMVNDPVQPEKGERINYGNLRTREEFEDFKLTLDVNVPANSNSGIYLRGIYEIQVLDSYGKELDSHNMGGVYSRITPTIHAEKPAGEWQCYEITLCDRHVTVILNGLKIIDNQPVYGPTGGALHADVFAPGPIYLQGDHGKVMYRNIILTPILK